MNGRACITGIGVVAPCGTGVAEHWENGLAGRSGITTLPPVADRAVKVAGQVSGFDQTTWAEHRLIVQTDRWTWLAFATTLLALQDAGLDPEQEDAEGLSVVTASASGGNAFGQREIQALWHDGPGSVSAYQSIGWFYAASSGQVSIRHQLKGQCGVLVADGAGGVEAVAQARRILDRGGRAVLAGGTEAPLSPYALACQAGDETISRDDVPERAYRPFAEDATGFVPGEGGAMLLVEPRSRARERGVRIYAEVAGTAATHDAPDPAHPVVTSRHLQRAIRLAVERAGLTPDDIDVVFADGAGYRASDDAEAEALTAVFGVRAVPVTVPKTMTGRLYSGGAALDLAWAALALHHGVIPPTVNVGPGRHADLDLVTAPRHTAPRTALVVARGTGGFNAAAVLLAADPAPGRADGATGTTGTTGTTEVGTDAKGAGRHGQDRVVSAPDTRTRWAGAPLTVPLEGALSYEPALLGTKAATLARLRAAGLPVPPGVIVTQAVRYREDGVLAAAAAVLAAMPGCTSFAVRSSAEAEDGPEHSYAGLYETYLGVSPEGLPDALRRCLLSAGDDRVDAYERAVADGTAESSAGMAVLVQQMVDARAAGVAFTAHPLTGDRDETVITAVRGLGERLVGGVGQGDEWIVSRGRARCVRAPESVLDEESALAVAALAERAANGSRIPQDVEWAIGPDGPVLLQCRPMTAVPAPVAWTPDRKGSWMRNFRFGEWLPEPVTPLFASWLLPLLERGFEAAMVREAGACVRFPNTLVNGWYYTAHPAPGELARALGQGRLRLVRYLRVMLGMVGKDPAGADRALLGRLAEAWTEDFLPRYAAAVESRRGDLDVESPERLSRLVDELGGLMGEAMYWMSAVGGAAWKMEGALARNLPTDGAGAAEGGVQWLLCGLVTDDPGPAGHAVHSLDWFRPTATEACDQFATVDRGTRAELERRRDSVEAAYRADLSGDPAATAWLDGTLRLARRYALLRERQARTLALALPVLRAAVLLFGERAVRAGVIARADDVFYLTREELEGTSWLADAVRNRRARWEEQRRLVPPLRLGAEQKAAERFLNGTVEAVRSKGPIPHGAIVGHPASPGRATGTARLVRGPEDFSRFRSGDVLVSHTTAPAWTPLFARAVAIVTDGGTLAAHASLVAREYGLPAVVGTEDATTRIRDGEWVTVDGTAGTVVVAHSSGAHEAGIDGTSAAATVVEGAIP